MKIQSGLNGINALKMNAAAFKSKETQTAQENENKESAGADWAKWGKYAAGAAAAGLGLYLLINSGKGSSAVQQAETLVKAQPADISKPAAEVLSEEQKLAEQMVNFGENITGGRINGMLQLPQGEIKPKDIAASVLEDLEKLKKAEETKDKLIKQIVSLELSYDESALKKLSLDELKNLLAKKIHEFNTLQDIDEFTARRLDILDMEALFARTPEPVITKSGQFAINGRLVLPERSLGAVYTSAGDKLDALKKDEIIQEIRKINQNLSEKELGQKDIKELMSILQTETAKLRNSKIKDREILIQTMRKMHPELPEDAFKEYDIDMLKGMIEAETAGAPQKQFPPKIQEMNWTESALHPIIRNAAPLTDAELQKLKTALSNLKSPKTIGVPNLEKSRLEELRNLILRLSKEQISDKIGISSSPSLSYEERLAAIYILQPNTKIKNVDKTKSNLGLTLQKLINEYADLGA